VLLAARRSDVRAFVVLQFQKRHYVETLRCNLWFVQVKLLFVAQNRYDMIHSFSSLSYDRSKASSKANSPHSAIQSSIFQ